MRSRPNGEGGCRPPRPSALLDPGQHQGLPERVAFFSIIIMWPCNNAAVAEIDVVRPLAPFLLKNSTILLVELARMVGVCGAGHHQDLAAAIVREVARP